MGWSYVVRYDPRGREINYTVAEEEDIEEEDDVEEQLVRESYEDVKEYQGDVEDNVLNEDVIHDDVLDKELEEVRNNVGEYVLDVDMFGIEDNDDNADMGTILWTQTPNQMI